MNKTRENTIQKQPVISPKHAIGVTDDTLHHLAFDNSMQPNIITSTYNGKIITVNSAACKLLGYSKKELLTKTRADIFDATEGSFKKILKQRTVEGHSGGLASVLKKSGKAVPCEITSAIFMDTDGIEKTIFTITDLTQSILKQKNIDTEKEKIVAYNIDHAKSEQKEIDIKKGKIVADNIVLAKSKQKEIDIKKEKIVAGNIDQAKSEQIVIDIKKEKIVANNIVLAKSKQKEIDIKKEKIVADNILLAKSEQKEIDIKKEKIVADNIVLAKSKQKAIDVKNKKIAGDNILLAQVKADARAAENNEWIKYIAKTSYDVMWDWDIESGQVYVGDSIEEVFGYKLMANTANFEDLKRGLLNGEKNNVQEKLMKILASGKMSWDDSYKIKRHDGSIATVTSRASIIRDEDGKAIRLIGATQDVSKLQELEKKLDEQSDKFFLAAKISFDVIWEWDLLTNDLFMGEGFKEMFGYTLKNNKGKISDWSNHLHPEDKEAVEKGIYGAIASSVIKWEHAYRFIRVDGSIARVFDRAIIIRQKDGKGLRMIGAMQDLSRQKELEEKLDHEIAVRRKLRTEYIESFKLFFNSSSDVLYDCDLVRNEVIISEAYEKDFGYTISNHMTPVKDWIGHIHPDDKESVMQDYQRALASDETEWKYNYRFLRADNSVANVVSNVIILRKADGSAYRMIGSMHDDRKQSKLEERLELEIKLKEKQIAEATEDAKETERSDIGKELHDNVNQLLAVSKLYLDLAKRGGENGEMYLSRSSEYTISAIEEIRKLSKGLTTDIIKNLGLTEAIDNITRDTMEVNPIKISCTLGSFDEHSVNNKFKQNLFRIVQEQLNNILKHARATNVTISLSQDIRSIMLTISDNGVGFDTGKKRKGIGMDNIKSRATSYNGTASFDSQPGKGCILTVTLPVTDAMMNKN